MRQPARGQTLVLFALTLLLLALGVALTLGLGAKVKERIDAQNTADAAAYSNAVAIARTYNVLAVYNRAVLSMMVAQTATASLVSWAGTYRGVLDGLANLVGDAQTGMDTAATGGNAACVGGGASVDGLNNVIADEKARVDAVWDSVDQAAGAFEVSENVAEQAVYLNGQKPEYEALEVLIRDQKLAGTVAARAGPGYLLPRINLVNMKEISRNGMGGAACDEMPGPGGGCDTGSINHQTEIYYGTRGDPFVTGRGNGGVMTDALSRKLSAAGNTTVTVTYAARGSGYRNGQDGNEDSATHGAFAQDPGASWADDEGTLSLSLSTQAGCTGNGTKVIKGFKKSNLSSHDDDLHSWNSGNGWQREPDAPTRHTLIGDIAGGNWPIVIDYNDGMVGNGPENFGMPKNYAVVQRVADNPNDPWKLNFTFKFNPLGSGSKFDNRGRRPDGTELLTAMSTGLAYYHRGNDWREPPNFVNPFWRATLVRPNVDASSLGQGGDIARSLNEAGDTEAAALADDLLGAGYKGFQ